MYSKVIRLCFLAFLFVVYFSSLKVLERLYATPRIFSIPLESDENFKLNISVDNLTKSFDGAVWIPKINVSLVIGDGLEVLTENKDFLISYDTDMVNVGKKDAKIVFIENYTSKGISFRDDCKINLEITPCSLSDEFVEIIVPSNSKDFILKYKNFLLNEGLDYKVTKLENQSKNDESESYKVEFTGNYVGTKIFEISLNKVSEKNTPQEFEQLDNVDVKQKYKNYLKLEKNYPITGSLDQKINFILESFIILFLIFTLNKRIALLCFGKRIYSFRQRIMKNIFPKRRKKKYKRGVYL